MEGQLKSKNSYPISYYVLYSIHWNTKFVKFVFWRKNCNYVILSNIFKICFTEENVLLWKITALRKIFLLSGRLEFYKQKSFLILNFFLKI